MTQTIGNAIAQRDEQQANTPRAMVMQYREEFTRVLPSHLRSEGEQEAWLRLAVGALKTGRMTGREFDLEIAARNNPHAFMQALRKAASLGLQPGTEAFYLTPRKVKGRLEILGITGYQGIIELMYRAGYVASVVCEIVHQNDRFMFSPGRDERPLHEVDWFAEDRGPVVGAYGYAIMHGGVTSRVVVLSEAQIQEIRKKFSQGSDSEYSPWQTNPDAMRLKTIVRRLKAWVPTSVEIRGQNGIPVIPVAAAADLSTAPHPGVGQLPIPPAEQADPTDTDEPVDAEIVEPAPPAEPTPEETPAEPVPAEVKTSTRQRKAPPAIDLGKLFNQKGFRDQQDRHEWVKQVLEDPKLPLDVALTGEQAAKVIAALNELSDVTQ
jgi:recombination protein RecT